MVGSTKIVSNASRFKPALNLNRVLADLNRGSNSLNSISDHLFIDQVVISICLSVCPIITQEPQDRFASNFEWGMF